MKQNPPRTPPHRSLAAWLAALVLVAACQGSGHVREAPAAFPAEAPASPTPPATDAEPSGQRFATPPGAELDATDDREMPDAVPETMAEPEAEPSAADGQHGASQAPEASAPARAEAKASPLRSRDADEPRAAASGVGRRGSLGSGSAWQAPAPEERPGLATHWGEDRYSPTHEVEFERADPGRPSVVAELHYNDRSGARRMLPEAGWGSAEKRLPSGVTLRLLDADGRTLPALVRGGRVVAIGAPGDRYSLAIENPTSRRFEVVASVDGLDVVDGQTARVEKRGYLVAPWSSVNIDGFRRSDDEVAAFRLGDVARSYAASKGKARNVGVIGFAFFDERRPLARQPSPPWAPPVSEDTRLRRSADPFPGSYARPPVW